MDSAEILVVALFTFFCGGKKLFFFEKKNFLDPSSVGSILLTSTLTKKKKLLTLFGCPVSISMEVPIVKTSQDGDLIFVTVRYR